jgi:hypothetical protein
LASQGRNSPLCPEIKAHFCRRRARISPISRSCRRAAVAFFPFLSAILVLILGHNPALERSVAPAEQLTLSYSCGISRL